MFYACCGEQQHYRELLGLVSPMHLQAPRWSQLVTPSLFTLLSRYMLCITNCSVGEEDKLVGLSASCRTDFALDSYIEYIGLYDTLTHF